MDFDIWPTFCHALFQNHDNPLLMRISSHIGNTHLEQMNLIYEFICSFDVENLLFAINGKRLNEDEIISLTNDIYEYHAKLKRQKQYLFDFCKTFPKEFASDDNKLVDSSVKITRRMRSGVAGVKKVFKRFCRISRKPLPEGASDVQAYGVTLINTPNIQIDCFGLSSYPQCVKDLFVVMYNFYTDLSECLEEGLRTVKEVHATRDDASKCLEILKRSCEKSRKNQRVLIEAITSDPDVKEAVIRNETFSGDGNEVLKDFKKSTSDMKGFAQKYYKNCSPKDVDKITIYKVTSEEEDDDMAFAKVVFGNDKDHIRKINFVIEQFDFLLPERCKRKKIPALNLYFFYEWCNPVVGIESFLKYFDKYYKEHGGKWETIGPSSIAGARLKHTMCKNGKTQTLKDEMLAGIDTIISKKIQEIEIAS